MSNAETTASFTDAMCIFIADCMAIAAKYAHDKAEAIKAMAESANAIFRDHPKTPESTSEVLAVIRQVATA